MKKVISHCLNLQIKASTFIKVNHLEIDEKYEILEVLGRGSFAVVFKAR